MTRNLHACTLQPPRSLEEIRADILALETGPAVANTRIDVAYRIE
jgi:hypothetical protein